MSSSKVKAGDVVKASVTEPTRIGGKTYFIKFSTEITVVSGGEDSATDDVIGLTLSGLSDLVGETIAARKAASRTDH